MSSFLTSVAGHPASGDRLAKRDANDSQRLPQVPLQSVSDLLCERLPSQFSPGFFRDRLAELGYCGIDTDPQVHEVVRQVSLLAYQHARRLQQIHLEGIDPATLPPKRNGLIVGKTGSGKTHLLTLVFEEILGLPCTVIDCSSMTSAGYVGDNVASILPRLIEKADKNVPYAQCGVVILDEIDKISRRKGYNNNWLKGETQNELLRLLQGGEVTASFSGGLAKTNMVASEVKLGTDDVMFVGCGAFSGIDSIISSSREASPSTDDLQGPIQSRDLSRTVFEQYGFVPEFVGRFSSFMALPPVSLETMKSIALSALQRERKRWELEGCDSDFDALADEEFVETIASDALAQDTGARGVLPQSELDIP